jgi:hypothetical protein
MVNMKAPLLVRVLVMAKESLILNAKTEKNVRIQKEMILSQTENHVQVLMMVKENLSQNAKVISLKKENLKVLEIDLVKHTMMIKSPIHLAYQSRSVL